MANHISHAALPYPVKGAKYTIGIPYLDADGDPLDPTTPDTEISKDGGAFADCTEEVTTISGSNGAGYITLNGAEMNASLVVVCAKVASGPKATLAVLYPRVLAEVRENVAQAGAAGSITLDASASDIDDYYNGCIVVILTGTGQYQARVISDYAGSTRVASVIPNWETTPDNTSDFSVRITEASWLRYADVRSWRGSQPSILSTGAVQSSVERWLGTIPSTLVSGRVDASVGAMAAAVLTSAAIAADAITAAKIAADAIGASELATDAVTEIQSGLATQALLTTVAGYIDTEIGDIQSRLPTALVNGRMDANVGAIVAAIITNAAFAAGAIDANAIATDAIGSAELAASAANEIADAILSRGISNVEGSAAFRTLYGAVASLVNKRTLSATEIVLYKSDDATILVTIPVTADATLNPVSSLDPP